MDTLEKTIDWTPMTESPPPESDSYLVTRKDSLMTTCAKGSQHILADTSKARTCRSKPATLVVGY